MVRPHPAFTLFFAGSLVRHFGHFRVEPLQMPIICFYLFTLIKFTHQSHKDNHEIIIFSNIKGPIDPVNISCQNIQCNFILKTTAIEFMAMKILANPVYSKISSINREQAVMLLVSLAAVVKDNLLQIRRK